jgi:hypothetical protein
MTEVLGNCGPRRKRLTSKLQLRVHEPCAISGSRPHSRAPDRTGCVQAQLHRFAMCLRQRKVDFSTAPALGGLRRNSKARSPHLQGTRSECGDGPRSLTPSSQQVGVPHKRRQWASAQPPPKGAKTVSTDGRTQWTRLGSRSEAELALPRHRRRV